MKLYNNDVNSFVIDLSGNVGIEKTPSVKLDISGNITALGGTINGTLNCTTGIYNSFQVLARPM
jgi:hypothetical protein